MDGYPLATIHAHESTRNGRAIYLEMLNHYKSKTDLEQLALLTFNGINDLQYTWKYPGGLPKFLHHFQDLTMDLQDAGRPIDGTTMKYFLLIKDHD